jgi:hypothetical protein
MVAFGSIRIYFKHSVEEGASHAKGRHIRAVITHYRLVGFGKRVRCNVCNVEDAKARFPLKARRQHTDRGPDSMPCFQIYASPTSRSCDVAMAGPRFEAFVGSHQLRPADLDEPPVVCAGTNADLVCREPDFHVHYFTATSVCTQGSVVIG